MKKLLMALLLVLAYSGPLFAQDSLQKAEEFMSDIDFSEVCESLIRSKFKKIPENREETKKIIAKLTAWGYNVGEIRRALERI